MNDELEGHLSTWPQLTVDWPGEQNITLFGEGAYSEDQHTETKDKHAEG